MKKRLMQQNMRWYGPNDPVTLSDILQAGCTGVVTALHQIPVGDVWDKEAILTRKALIEKANLQWTVVESLPVSEDIKRQTKNYKIHIEHYKQSIINLAACGIKVITYNFMPVLDWLRTNVYYQLPNGSTALYFNKIDFVVFDVFLLERLNAKSDFSVTEIQLATNRFQQMTAEQKKHLFNNLMLGLPGSDEAFTKEMVLAELEKYAHIDANKLKAHLFYFLNEVCPIAESCGVKLAIHPDDPPYPVLGLPRIMSTANDVKDLLQAVPLAANGLCFCTGSFGARADNDIVQMIQQFGNAIHFLHLRNTKRDAEGNFFEANHLEGDTNMVAVINEILKLQQARNIALPMRPDHGHQMLDDLNKKTYPGYSAIGRLKGLAEIRGVEIALATMM